MDDIIQEYIAHLSVSEPSKLPERLRLFGWGINRDWTMDGFVFCKKLLDQYLDHHGHGSFFGSRDHFEPLNVFFLHPQGIWDFVGCHKRTFPCGFSS